MTTTYQTGLQGGLLTLRNIVDGVQTASGVVSVTIGITRTSDGSTILAASTATTAAGGGLYTYDPTALALSASLAYSAAWVITDASGPHTVTDTIEAADSSRTLAAYRQNVQYELGRFITGTTTSANANATDLICSTLVDSDGHTTSYAGWYALISSGALAGAERPIAAKTGFTAATGTLTAGRTFGGLAASGVSFELASRLPATALDGVRGVNFAVNWALQRLWFRDRISFTPVANQKFYSLLPWAHWLDRELRIGRVYRAAVDAFSNPEPQAGGAWLRYDGELPMLELDQALASTDTIFYVEVIRPGHTWIKTGGGWSESTVGLTADTDEALCAPNLVTQLALVECYRQLANGSVGNDRQAWLQERAVQAAGAARLRAAMLVGFPQGAASATRRVLTPYPSLRY